MDNCSLCCRSGNTKGHEIEILEAAKKHYGAQEKKIAIRKMHIHLQNYPSLLMIQGVNSLYDTDIKDPKLLTPLGNQL